MKRIKVRFHLGKGKNFMKWRIQYPNGDVQYIIPTESQHIKIVSMNTSILNEKLDNLEVEVSRYFSELLEEQEEFVIFAEEDLEHDTPDDYLEVRNDMNGNVFDVHPLRVTKEGILVVESDGSFAKHLIRIHDLSSTQDKITLCELMENILNQ